MCAVTCAGAPDTLCTCPVRGPPGAAGVCVRQPWRTRSTWRIWRTRRDWHARAQGVPGARGAPGTSGAHRPSVAHLGSALVPSSCPSKDKC
eukprot:7606133-Pyramimonas_sp.AAC.1